jgi:uncharacterized membrane protein
VNVRTFARALAAATTLATTTAVLATPAAAAAPPHWALTLLPLPAGHEDATGFVNGTDGHGGYAGSVHVGDDLQVVTWADDRPTLRGAPVGTSSPFVADENAAGTIIGTAVDDDSSVATAFLLDGSGYRILPNLSPSKDAVPMAINDRGDVVGTASTADGFAVPLLWPADDLDHPIHLAPGLLSAAARDIDDDGTVLLDADADGVQLLASGTLTRLPDPVGYSFLAAGSLSATLVVGTAPSTTVPGADGFVWCRPDNPTTCGSDQPQALPRSDSALYVNESGVIVGRERGDDVDGPLAVWQDLGFVERLAVPEGQRGSAAAIGADGAIVGIVAAGPLDDGGRPAVWRPVAH